MAKERRDSKNRILWKGEHQRKDGRYMYRYKDTNGDIRFVYSWRLTKTDKVPKGKPYGPCLRDMEIQIGQDLIDKIDTFGAKNYTIEEYFEKYMATKKKLKATTRSIYRQNYERYLRARIGEKAISSIQYSDVRKLYIDIIDEDEIALTTLATIDSLFKPMMKMAVRDNLLRNNPVDGVLAELKKERGGKTTKKQALTIQQQNAFLDFVSKSPVYSKWLNLFTVMLGTGCRVGELCALTWDDCDFAGNALKISRTLCYGPDEITKDYVISIQSPKTDSGDRTIPMLKDVKYALRNERIKQMQKGFSIAEVDGIRGFIFCNRKGKPLVPRNVNSTLNRLIKAFNEKEELAAAEENRSPLLLPHITPHILRHTFCTRLVESEVNIKVIQEVMGHSEIATTLDIYTSVTQDFKNESFNKIEGAFRIG